MIPSEPNSTKVVRQPKRVIVATTRTGVIAAPNRDPACVIPCAYPRSAGSIQRDRDLVAIGNAPASPMPNKNRNTAIDAASQAKMVSDVKMLHQVTIQVRARLAPKRSPSHPLGMLNKAYPQRKELR